MKIYKAVTLNKETKQKSLADQEIYPLKKMSLTDAAGKKYKIGLGLVTVRNYRHNIKYIITANSIECTAVFIQTMALVIL